MAVTASQFTRVRGTYGAHVDTSTSIISMLYCAHRHSVFVLLHSFRARPASCQLRARTQSPPCQLFSFILVVIVLIMHTVLLIMHGVCPDMFLDSMCNVNRILFMNRSPSAAAMALHAELSALRVPSHTLLPLRIPQCWQLKTLPVDC